MVKDDPEVSEEHGQVGVGAVVKGRLGIRAYQLGVEVPEQLDLAISPNGGDDSLDGGVRESGVYVVCLFLQGRIYRTGGGVLGRY